ncbi:MAG: phosphate ABC transporter substrate-binding protein [Candidatus Heimdallarchaeota archaeon]|nr:phosphate ABC transporter substrate-binding protein [Candidatus Heimdallarchaeota archaeon]MBY8996007.1 phosphate ABC transporter substrate-binding protein [Candidatus Heimdallarchaeota archaeon]
MSFSRKRDRLVIILIILIPVAAVSGWFLARSANNAGETYFVTIEGSNTVYKIIDLTSKAFTQTQTGVTISVTGSGTGSGITAIIDGQADIAMASRPYKDTEQTAANGSLEAVAFAKDALSIVIHASANPLDLTIDVARAIFNGTISDWSHPAVNVTGLSGTIQVVVRESGSGTRDAFNELVMGDSSQIEPGSQYVSSAIQKSSNQLIKDAVATNSNYIGYIGLGYIDSEVRATTINGIEPTLENVLNESYFIQRELFLITFGIPEGMVWKFISWSISPEGQDLVLESGFINAFPTSDDVYT